MRIVMLGPFGLHPKGTMRARALPAARALVGRGHHVTMLLPPWQTPGEAGKRWHDDGVELRNVSLKGLRVPLVGPALVAVRMAREALAERPDIIHVFKPKAYGALAADFLRPRPCPVIVDTDDWEGRGGWNEREPYAPWQKRLFIWQERHALTTADAVTVASRGLETLVWALGVPPRKVVYLPNSLGIGYDVDPEEPRPDTDAPRLLLYSRLAEFPVARPIDVLVRVRREHPGAKIVLVGRGLRGEESALAAEAAHRGLAGAIEDHGWLEPPQARAVFRTCHVALWPFDDNLINRTKGSVKLLELMAAGVPIVAEAVGQNAIVVEHERSGVLVPPGDVRAFSEAVVGLLADRQRARQLAAGARRRIATCFSWHGQSAQLEDLYMRLEKRHN